MIPIKILLVDDQNLIREGIKSLIHLRQICWLLQKLMMEQRF